jgi:hypothetical protein
MSSAAIDTVSVLMTDLVGFGRELEVLAEVSTRATSAVTDRARWRASTSKSEGLERR